jgi:2-polyprenyl-6-methoxyphenol hydroxylase-like FAD-dependent oxidoreductase
MVLADVRFSSDPVPTAAANEAEAVLSPESFFILMPLAPFNMQYQGFNNVYRLFCGVPMSSGPPPHAPSIPYLQDLVDKYGPTEICSDPSFNQNPVEISDVLWSTRFRTHSSIADRFFTRFVPDSPDKSTSDQDGGVILLIGDAAHIHSPAGGQGTS